jgi:TolA-binding protein
MADWPSGERRQGSRRPAGASQPASSQPAAADTQTSPDYDKALNLLRARDFAKATAALSLYIQQNPNAPQAVDALYWLGVAHTAQRQYDAAIEIHRRFAEQYPDNPKAPDALRNVPTASATWARWILPRPRSSA